MRDYFVIWVKPEYLQFKFLDCPLRDRILVHIRWATKLNCNTVSCQELIVYLGLESRGRISSDGERTIKDHQGDELLLIAE